MRTLTSSLTAFTLILAIFPQEASLPQDDLADDKSNRKSLSDLYDLIQKSNPIINKSKTNVFELDKLLITASSVKIDESTICILLSKEQLSNAVAKARKEPETNFPPIPNEDKFAIELKPYSIVSKSHEITKLKWIFDYVSRSGK